MNYKLSIGLLALAALLAFSCKKKKKEEEVPSTTSGPDGYFFKAKVNGFLLEKEGGLDAKKTTMTTEAYDMGGGEKRISYFSEISGMNSSFFELSRPNIEFSDGDDSDEMTSVFQKGDGIIDAGGNDGYSITYHSSDGSLYFFHTSAPAVTISIDSVADLGRNSNKRVVKVMGSIDSIRLYEYDYDNLTYTSNFVDITDAEFALPYKSNSNY